MKTCPVCQAQCFDDMDICYGCMHRFDYSVASPAGEQALGDARAQRKSRPSEEGGVAQPSESGSPEPAPEHAQDADPNGGDEDEVTASYAVPLPAAGCEITITVRPLQEA